MYFTPHCTDYLEKMKRTEQQSIQQMVKNVIEKCDETIQDEMWRNVVLSGGSSLIPGFKERFEDELQKIAPEGTKVNVIPVEDRDIAVWKGGSQAFMNEGMKEFLFLKEEYDECGAMFIHRKAIF